MNILSEDKNLERRLQIEALYENAIQSQASEVAEMKRDEAYVIPKDIDYNSDSLNLSFEEREKLMAIQPQTVSYFYGICCLSLFTKLICFRSLLLVGYQELLQLPSLLF